LETPGSLQNSTFGIAAFVLLKRFPHKWAIKTQIVMTPQESKLAKKMERRLQEHALQQKNYRQEIKAEGMDSIARNPLRIHQQMIQRAQFYTGDA
jgi:hypothetical protein